jgi:hypothetical protein
VWQSQDDCDRFYERVVNPVMARFAAQQPEAADEPVMQRFGVHGDPLAAAIDARVSSFTELPDSVRAIIVDIDGKRRSERYYSSSKQSTIDFSVTKRVM